MSTQTRATLGDLGQRNVGPEFEEVFNQTDMVYQGKEIASKIISFLNVDKSTFRTTGLTGYPLLKQYDEGTPMPEALNIKTFETPWDIFDYGISTTVTEDCLADKVKLQGKLDEYKNLAAMVAPSEVQAGFNILNGGLTLAITFDNRLKEMA